MSNWGSILTFDAITALLSSENKAVAYFAARDLLETAADGPESLWELPAVQSIIRKQQQNGSWKYPAGNTKIRSFENYDQIETYRNLGYLIESYGLNKNHPAIPKAANFLFQFQSSEGDIRGILGNQYSPYYTAGMLELLIKAGYSRDEHILKAFKWLKAIRQDDGGWAMPLRTRDEGLRIISTRAKTLEPDRTKPYSHMVTGIVLRT
jgi:Squalene-hopene cyclase C-terminal domain